MEEAGEVVHTKKLSKGAIKQRDYRGKEAGRVQEGEGRTPQGV